MQPDLHAVDHPALLAGALCCVQASIGLGGWIKALGMWLLSGSVIALGAMQPTGTEDRASARMLA